MGASSFMVIGFGKTAKSAFNILKRDALCMHGADGYSGTIAEKTDFRMITPPMGVMDSNLEAVNVLVEDALNDWPGEAGNEYYEWIWKTFRKIENKWGKAGCIKLAGSAREVACLMHGMHGNAWIFFGFSPS